MPIMQSAKKDLRKAKKRNLANRVVTNAYKMAVKEVLRAIDAGKEVNEVVRLAQKMLDKAVEKNVLKPNTAARKLSRLMKRVHATHTTVAVAK